MCTWLTGPDAGGVQRVTWQPGADGTSTRAVIGRAGAFRCDDPGLLAHHVVVEARAVLPPQADDDGLDPCGHGHGDAAHGGHADAGDAPTAAGGSVRVDLWVTRLAGRVDVRTPDGPLHSRHQIAHGTVLQLASSTCRLEVEAPTDRAGTASRARAVLRATDDVVVRAPRVVPSVADLALVEHLATALGLERAVAPDTRSRRRGTTGTPPGSAAPPERERPGGLVPTLVGLLGSTIVALVTGRPMFLLFGALGSTVALSSWIGQWVAFGRRHRRDTAQHRAAIAHDAASRAAARTEARSTIETLSPSLADALVTADRDDRLWSCRRNHPDAFVVSLGRGDVRLSTTELGVLSEAPVCTVVGPARRIALRGPLARAVSRSIVVQLITRCGPADLRLVVVTDRPSDWHWVRHLPHAQITDASDDRASCLVDTSGSTDHALADVLTRLGSTGGGEHVVVVTDQPHLLVEPSTALRHAIDHTDVALVVIAEDGAVPTPCTAVLDTHGLTAVFVADTSQAREPLTLRAAGLGPARASEVARALRGRRDPEVVVPAGALLPSAVSLASMVGPLDEFAIAARWRDERRGLGVSTPIGAVVDRDRVAALHLDLVRDGPHALVAGTTGSGKSELLRSLVVGLALAAPPDELAVVLVDYKGGAAFDVLGRLPHVVGTVTDLDDHLADRMLRSLRAELRRREHVLRDHGVSDLRDLQHHRLQQPPRHDADVPPRLVIVVDEFAALVAERPSFLHALVGIAQRGRSLGLHLVLATQRPTGVVSDDIRANTSVRIALRLHDRADALDVVGDDLPTVLPRHRPGRAVLRDGDRCVVFQSAQCTDLSRTVDDIARAAAHAARYHGAPTASSQDGAVGRAPWLPPLPDVLEVLPHRLHIEAAPGVPMLHVPMQHSTNGRPIAASVGVLDDPDHQRYVALAHDPHADGLIVAGSSGTGVTSTLAAVIATAPHDHEAVFVLDVAARRTASGDPGPSRSPDDPWTTLDRVGALDRIDARDHDRLVRLLHELAAIASRTNDAHARALLVIDGFDRVRRVLDAPAHDPRPEHRHDTWLEQLLAAVLSATTLDVMIGTSDPAGVPPQLLARCGTRWVHHLVDPHAASTLGVPASLVPPRVPGRIAADGLVGQVLSPATALAAPTARRPPRRRLVCPAPVVTIAELDGPSAPPAASGPARVTVGVDLMSGERAVLTIGDGDHVMVIGPPGSGRSTAVATIGDALHRALGPERVVVVDDADRIDDRDGALARMAADGVVIVAAGRGEPLRQRTGHWSSLVRRSRTGLVLAGPQCAADGDLLGVGLPRGFPVDVRPGRGWLIDHGEVTLVQCAVTAPATGGRRGSPNLHR